MMLIKLNQQLGKLTEASMKLGEAVYKQAQQEQANSEQGTTEESNNEKVVDAEFEEVKKDDKDK
jgi:molecular chaperone DnaK